jgi:hypothetical protein
MSSSTTTSVFSTTTGADVLLIVSNLAFLIPAIKGIYMYKGKGAAAKPWRLRHRTIVLVASAIYIAIILASGTYHMCNSYSATCLFGAATHKSIDFFFAQLVIPLSALILIGVTAEWSALDWWWMVFFGALLFVLEITVGEGFVVQMALALSCFALLATYWIGYAVQSKRGKTGRWAFPKYNWDNFIMGISITFMAVSLFATQMQWHSGYWAIHSTWHVLGALGQYFLLTSWDPPLVLDGEKRAVRSVTSIVEDTMVVIADGMFDILGGDDDDDDAERDKITHLTPASMY